MTSCFFILPRSRRVIRIETTSPPSCGDVVTLRTEETEASTNTFKVHNVWRTYTETGLSGIDLILRDFRPGEDE